VRDDLFAEIKLHSRNKCTYLKKLSVIEKIFY